MRNDLGRVSRLGSVTVPALCALETFASVHHLVSEVRSVLAPGRGPVDLLRPVSPRLHHWGAQGAGHGDHPRTGARAARALLRQHRWIGFDGAMDSSIVIRTLVRAGETLVAQAGGASSPTVTRRRI